MNEGQDRVISSIQEVVEPVLADKNIELVEIQFRREGYGWVLRFFIDKEEGVTIDDCAEVSREISACLEVEEIIDHAYFLEVSSPGLERPLKKVTDYARFGGRKARIKVKEPLEGQRVFIGTLQGIDGELVLLEVDGQVMHFALEDIAKARLVL